MSAENPRRLGRGLEALISTAKQQRDPVPPVAATTTRDRSELQRVRIVDITPNRFQPRRTFTETELAELEASLKASGLLQPITVRPKEGGKWELIAGERRLRAATRLGWTEIPAVVRDFDDRAMLTLALVENLQRADLNPLEEADGYQRLIDEFGLTQLQVAEAVGKDRTTITNLLRLLGLPPAIRSMVEQGAVTAGHAKALLPLKDEVRQIELAGQIVRDGLSVREVETRVRAHGAPPPDDTGAPLDRRNRGTPYAADPNVRRVEEQLRKRLQTDVTVQAHTADRGTVRIAFYSHDDLDRLMELIMGAARTDFD